MKAGPFILPLLLLACIHAFLINPLEKQIVYAFAPESAAILRPEPECGSNPNMHCLGMPSGHSEVAALLGVLLYKLNIVSLPVAIVFVVLTGFQRIWANRHTVQQVLVGWSLGIIYGFLYIGTLGRKSQWTAPLIGIGITFFLTILLTMKVNSIIKSPVPNWVNRDLYPAIYKKQNAMCMNKYILTNSFLIDYTITVFYTWPMLETKLNSLLTILSDNKEQYDAIIGVKTGGAILASYLHEKSPSLPVYFIKSEKRDANTSSKIDDSSYTDHIVDTYRRYILKSADYKYEMKEGIDDDLTGKTVLLIDETIETGQSIAFAKQYLEKEKKVKRVIVATINYNKLKSKKNTLEELNPYIVSANDKPTIWPWGYDN